MVSVSLTKSETNWKLLVCFPSPYTVKGSFLKACIIATNYLELNNTPTRATTICNYIIQNTAKEYLSNKITDNATIIDTHTGSISVENSSNPNLKKN